MSESQSREGGTVVATVAAEFGSRRSVRGVEGVGSGSLKAATVSTNASSRSGLAALGGTGVLGKEGER